MLYLSEQVREAIAEPTEANFEKLNQFAANMLMGSGPKAKIFYFKEGYVVTNILTIIEKLDRKLETPFMGSIGVCRSPSVPVGKEPR